ncbi:FAD/NAD(P)-binding protein [Metabacillus sp. FJAT-52054]|uniref:FAD/NAD(P)-binding protein n=1 Tax=Metabacillus sediminis TaxID=3117746 RepID=A0ABZ2NED8_9BACI
MFDWIIIGGGIQGISAASFLIESGRFSSKGIKIMDPHSEPLANWKTCTSLISMPYLRSPSVHHLEADPFGLQKYSKKKQDSLCFYGRYKRPSLSIFNEHCDELIKKLNVKDCWIKDEAVSITKKETGWQVETKSTGRFHTARVILALGIGGQPHIPEWARNFRESDDEEVYHVFDQHLPPFEELKEPITVVGGGITAAHLLIKLAQSFPGKVTQVSRHKIRIKDFDSDPAWIGDKNQSSFRKISDYTIRRKKIKEARHRGTMPREIALKLNRLKTDRVIKILNSNIQGLTKNKNGFYEMQLESSPAPVSAGTILMATGFDSQLPGQQLLKPLIKNKNLPCAPCGYPIVSNKLEWAPDLFVMGALAELEVGPVARNITGARQAAERIASIFA